VRVEETPVALENPVFAPSDLDSDDDEATRWETQIEREVQRRLNLRSERIREIERNLETRRQEQLAEIANSAAQTRQELQVLREEAEQELAQLHQQTLVKAEAEGFAKGHQAGYEQGYGESQSATENMHREALEMLQEAAREAERRVLEGEHRMLDLTFAICHKVLEISLTQQEELVLQQIRLSLAQFRQAPQVIIKVPQSRYQKVYENLANLKEEFRQIVTLDCLADPSLPLTDVVIESPFGMMEVRYDAQLSILQEALHQLVREQMP